MSKKYLSILSALMLIGSSFVSAMDEYPESYGSDSNQTSVNQDQSFDTKSEFGALKGKTKLPGKKSKACKEALNKCQEFNDCEDLKQCQNDGWKDYGDGKVGFSQTVVGNPESEQPKYTIHGKRNPYANKARKLDIKAGYLPNKRIGSEKLQEELEFFDKVPDTAAKTLTQKDMLKKSNWDFESEHIGKNASQETEDLFDNVPELDIDD